MCHLKVNDNHFTQYKVDSGAEGHSLPVDEFRKRCPKAKISNLHNDGVELEYVQWQLNLPVWKN